MLAYDRASLISGLKAQSPSIKDYILESLVDLWLKDPQKVKDLAREDQIKQAKLKKKPQAIETRPCLYAGAVEVRNPEETQ